MSNARSPRGVCSTTMGTSGLIVLASFAPSGGFLPTLATALGPADASAVGCPELPRPLRRRLLVGRPQRLASLRLLDRDRLGLAHEELHRLARGDILAQLLEATVLPPPIEQLLGA